MAKMTYRVEHYAADGHAGPEDDYVIADHITSLAEARRIVRQALRVSALRPERKWHGGEDSVEAYHDVPESAPNSYGCGGVAIVATR